MGDLERGGGGWRLLVKGRQVDELREGEGGVDATRDDGAGLVDDVGVEVGALGDGGEGVEEVEEGEADGAEVGGDLVAREAVMADEGLSELVVEAAGLGGVAAQVAAAGEAEGGALVAAEVGGEAAHFGEAAGEEGGLEAGAEVHLAGDAVDHGDEACVGGGDLGAAQVVAAVDAAVGGGEGVGDEVEDLGEGRGADHAGAAAREDIFGAKRAGGEAEALGMELISEDVRAGHLGVGLEAAGGVYDDVAGGDMMPE